MFEKFLVKPLFVPACDEGFRPIVLENRAFIKSVNETGDKTPAGIAVIRGEDTTAVYHTVVFSETSNMDEENNYYIERLVKTLLWIKGGWKIVFGGPEKIGKYLKEAYRSGGGRGFDSEFMGSIYEKSFTVEICGYDDLPERSEITKALGGYLDGFRIGLDLGGSDRKVASMENGTVVYSEEVEWDPKLNEDPDYHYKGIMDSVKRAAEKLPKVDAIGVSAAGVYINNRVMAASLFMKIPGPVFDSKVKDIFFRMQDEMEGVPFEVANDGDVAALAGAMSLNDVNVLGISMGTSEAGGYVDCRGNITGWLNELAFVPVDNNPDAMPDEWSGDIGCGVKYFSQDSVIKLAKAVGIEFDESLSPTEKLKIIQKSMEQDDMKSINIFDSIGCYLGYSIAYYSGFYDIKHVLLLGRVMSGKGGDIIIVKAGEVLKVEFPELSADITLHLPDEKTRRLGQSIVAASLPEIN